MRDYSRCLIIWRSFVRFNFLTGSREERARATDQNVRDGKTEFFKQFSPLKCRFDHLHNFIRISSFFRWCLIVSFFVFFSRSTQKKTWTVSPSHWSKTSKSYKPGSQLPLLVFVSETFENEASIQFLLVICDAWNMCEALNSNFMVPAVLWKVAMLSLIHISEPTRPP